MIAEWLCRALEAGPLEIGQIRIHPDFVIHHAEEDREALVEIFREPEAAERIARWDEKGAFRSLKTAPNLRRGWRLELESLSDVRLAIEGFYPAVLGHAAAIRRGDYRGIALRDMLARQSGMYAVTRKATDEELLQCVREVCDRSRCLNLISWELAPGMPIPATPPAIPREGFPLLCSAACPLLIGAIRAKVKARPPG